LGSIQRADRTRRCLAEMLGTYLLVFLGPGSIVLVAYLGFPAAGSLVFVAGVFGGTVAGVILLLGRFSGANINPAVTIGSTVAGTSRRGLLLPYLAFQASGAILAGLTLRAVFGNLASSASLGSTKLAAGISPTEGAALEVVGTFLLVASALVAGSFLTSPGRQAILVGGTLFLLILLIGPLTGGSFNPARSLGPSLFSGYFRDQLVYYVGPVLGGFCAGLAFQAAMKLHGKGDERTG
jgi:aquaporin Z